MRVESEELPFYATEPKQAGPAPWPGIAEARAIGNKETFFMLLEWLWRRRSTSLA